jgi:sulfide dehydrogenase cytochrome subunit
MEIPRFITPGRLCRIACLAGVLFAATAGPAEMPEVAQRVCSTCHGAGGASENPLVPTLAGQPYTLIEDNLLAFRSGQRSCSPQRADGSPSAVLAQTMCEQVRNLQDHEIAELAGYFEGRAFVPARQEFDSALAGRGAAIHREAGCDRCHALGGRETLGMAPVLAGQWTPYLRRALNAIRSGTRHGPKMMNEPLRQLDDAAVEALLNYYASEPGTAPR